MARESAHANGRHGKHCRLLTEPVSLDLVVGQGRLELLGVKLQPDLFALVCAEQILQVGAFQGDCNRVSLDLGVARGPRDVEQQLHLFPRVEGALDLGPRDRGRHSPSVELAGVDKFHSVQVRHGRSYRSGRLPFTGRSQRQ